MTRDMRRKHLWFVVFLVGFVAISVVFLSQRMVVRKQPPPVPDSDHRVQDVDFESQYSSGKTAPARHRRKHVDRVFETSSNEPLQRALETAFPDSFREGVDIFWESSDDWISPEVFEWWVSRLAEGDIDGLSREAAERMFSHFSEEGPVFSVPARRRICAVVGASANLLESGYGDLIDGHDFVFRVNRAQTDLFENDVGEKTTHHVMWPRELEEWQFNRESDLLITPVSANNKDVFDRIVHLVVDDFRWDPRRVRIIHPEFVKYVHEEWTDGRMAYPSTGFIALMIALHVCDEVDAFGFGADADGRWDRYYEDVPEDISQFHPADSEAQLMREMEEKGILRIYRGNRRQPSAGADTSSKD